MVNTYASTHIRHRGHGGWITGGNGWPFSQSHASINQRPKIHQIIGGTIAAGYDFYLRCVDGKVVGLIIARTERRLASTDTLVRTQYPNNTECVCTSVHCSTSNNTIDSDASVVRGAIQFQITRRCTKFQQMEGGAKISDLFRRPCVPFLSPPNNFNAKDPNRSPLKK